MAQLLDLAEIPAKKSPQLPDQEKTEGVLLTAARSFAYMGVQEPVNGLGQLVGKVSGQDVLPHIQFIAPVKQSEFGSANWHAEQVGAGLGIAMDFLILKKGMGKAALASRGLVGTQSLKFVSAALPRSIAGNPMAMHTVSSIGAGLAFEGVFRPVDESKGSFIGQRIKHAVEGGVTFGMLSAGSGLVKHLGSNRLGPGVIRNLLKSDITSNAIAGAPAGITRAQLSGVLDNGRPAGVGETLETAYAYTLVGGLMGGLNVGGRKASDYYSRRISPESRSLNVLIIEDAKGFRGPIEQELHDYGIKRVTGIAGVDHLAPDHIFGIRPGRQAKAMEDTFNGDSTRIVDLKAHEFDVVFVDGDFIGKTHSGTEVIPELKRNGVPLVIAISGGGAGNKPLMDAGADIGVPKELVKPLIHEGKLRLKDLALYPEMVGEANRTLPGEVEALRKRMMDGEDFEVLKMDD